MRHHVSVPKLGKTTSHRRAMLRNMVTSLFEHERITTTVTKAKEARRWADRMITFAKRGDLHARRRAARFVNNETVLKKLFDEIAPALAERPGGYTRVLRVGVRKGDVAEKAILELVTRSPAREKPKNRKSPERLKEFKVATVAKATGQKKPKPETEAEAPSETPSDTEATDSPADSGEAPQS